MSRKALSILIICTGVCLFTLTSIQPALPSESPLVLIGRSQFFDIYGHSSLDIISLVQKLDMAAIRPENILVPQDGSVLSQLALTLDAVYLETSDILDIHIYNGHLSIKFLDSAGEVCLYFKQDSGMDVNERSVYLNDNATIYISLNDITLGMLGHEIAHAIISSFFIVPPPEKIQEVLAGYVDYSLLKKSRAIRSPAVNIINTNNLPQPVAAHSDPGESNVTSISSTTNSAL